MRKRLRPDYICGDPNARVAKVIVEVKRLDVNLEQRSGRLGWSTSPAGQLHRYLNKHARSGPGTWGVLTNGMEWLVVRREGDACRTEDFANIQSALSLDQIDALLKPIIESKAPETKPVVTETPTVDWLEAVASCTSPSNFIDRVAPHLNTTTTTNGVFAKVGEYMPDGELLSLPAYIACLELNLPDGYLAPQDIAEELNQTDLYGHVVGVAYIKNPDGHRLVRGFHLDNNRILATALVEPDLPGSRALNQFATLSLHAAELPSNAIAEALSSDPLHRQFHEEIGAWFSAGSQDLDTEQLGNRLRHLIRVMFTWLLQVRGVIPDDAL